MFMTWIRIRIHFFSVRIKVPDPHQIKIKWILSTGVSYLTVLRTRAVVGETKLNKISVPWTPILLLSSSRRMLHLLHSRILNIVT